MRLPAAAILTAVSVLAGSSMLAASANAAPEPGTSPASSKSAAAAGGSAAVPRLNVLSMNAMLLPSFITDGWAQDERGALMGSAPHVQGHDVVVFQELMDNSSSDILMEKLQGYPYRTPVVGRSKDGWDDTQGDYSMFAPEDGGVAIVSRWPITKRIQYIYDEACGTDSLSQKGFAYARLNVGGSPVHVLGTHLQADDSMCSDGEAAEIRTSQLRELRSFVDGLNIPQSEPVLFAGDLNVDRYGSEYAGMLGSLDAEAPAYDGHPYTMDPVANGVARERYEGEPQAWLDYILYDRRHARPSGWRNTGLTPASPPWELDGTTYRDYSDHYPIQGS